jgi:VanZ family protein
MLFLASAVPGGRQPRVGWLAFPHADKLVHAVLYGVLAGLIARALTHSTRWSALRTGLATIAISMAYGVSDEIHQAFVPLREADPSDVLADGVGATLGTCTYLVFSSKWNRRSPR